MYFRTTPTVAAIVCMLATACGVQADDDVAAEIKKLVPSASAMSRDEFVKMATSTRAPKESDFEDKNLTAMLFSLRYKDDEKRKAEFRITSEVPKPSRIAREMNRQIGAGRFAVTLLPLTMIHADRIKDVTCEVEGDTARGTIKYEVPDLYAGQVEYAAKKMDDRWTITEFHLPAHGIHIERHEKGTWRRQTDE